MKRNHINRPVVDVAASRDVGTRYFGLGTTMELGRGAVALMRDEGDMVLMPSHFDTSAELHYPRDFHVGFHLETRAEFDNVRAPMNSGGLDVALPRTRQGRYVFYLRATAGS